MSEMSKIASIDVGNAGTALLEIFVSRTASPGEEKVLLPTALLMTAGDSRSGTSTQGVRMFGDLLPCPLTQQDSTGCNATWQNRSGTACVWSARSLTTRFADGIVSSLHPVTLLDPWIVDADCRRTPLA